MSQTFEAAQEQMYELTSRYDWLEEKVHRLDKEMEAINVKRRVLFNQYPTLNFKRQGKPVTPTEPSAEGSKG